MTIQPSNGRAPDFLPDRSAVFLQGYYTFDELLAISNDDRLSPRSDGSSVWDDIDDDALAEEAVEQAKLELAEEAEALDPDRLREDRDDRLACLRDIGGED